MGKPSGRRDGPGVSRREARRQARQRDRARRRLLFVGVGLVAFVTLGFLFLRGGDALSTRATTPALAVPYQAPVLGDASAPVTIVEYADFQCPACGAFFRSIEPQLVAEYVKTGKAKFVFKHFAWKGPESKRAAEAASCAGAQGKFWEYHDLLYANQHGENTGFFSAARLKQFAAQLSLDQSAFDACLDAGVYRAAIDADASEVRRLGLLGTPSFTVNGQLAAPTSLAAWKSLIESKLAGR